MESYINLKNKKITEDCWLYETQEKCQQATGKNGIIVSYGKNGLIERRKESKNSFILFPKSWM